ncbi:MAG: helix-turn-helix domain-containing protein [Bradyrhizobium sp.]|nr:helix-turn-helix domain-containing protein [Pseudomonadota bacterium]MDE2472912.1 helix-turn-helix domain-containing protein [Bradyrhizobium sp.]
MLTAAANPSNYIRPSEPVRITAFPKDPLGVMGATMRFGRNAEIFGEDEEAEYLYQVISGAVRTYRMLDDGRRQVVAFYLPGDVFGMEAANVHRCSAEAIAESQVLVLNRASVMGRAEREMDLSRQLWMLIIRELQRVQQHSLVLIKSAEERVAGFLLEMAGRYPGNGAIELQMSRRDIADYLGLTIETVSRTFTLLVQSGAISLETSRRIQFRNRAALRRLDA